MGDREKLVQQQQDMSESTEAISPTNLVCVAFSPDTIEHIMFNKFPCLFGTGSQVSFVRPLIITGHLISDKLFFNSYRRTGDFNLNSYGRIIATLLRTLPIFDISHDLPFPLLLGPDFRNIYGITLCFTTLAPQSNI